MIDNIGDEFVGQAKSSVELPDEQWAFSREQIVLQLNTWTVARIYSMYPHLLTGGVKGGEAWDIAEAYKYVFYDDNDFLEIVNLYGPKPFSVVEVYVDGNGNEYTEGTSFFTARDKISRDDEDSLLDVVFKEVGINT